MTNRSRLKSSQTHPAPLAPASPEERAVSQTGSASPVTAVSAPSRIATDETLRECFIQASENARAYMDLRFKHFGTFVLLTGLLGTAAFQVDELSPIRPSLAGVALVLSGLFWLLDFRTSQYLAAEFHRIRFFKELLAVPSTNVPKHTVVLRSSYATNLIFLVVVVMWSIICLFFLSIV